MGHSLRKILLGITLFVGSVSLLYGETHQAIAPPPFEPHPVFVSQTTKTHDLDCLTRAIYYEAGHESVAGKEAVALVIVNRVVSRRYPNTVCGVIAQSFVVNEKRICQFSFHCEPSRKVNFKIWHESHDLAKRVLTNTFSRAILLRIGNATYFHAVYVHPQWSKQKVFVTAIDHHLFYKEPSL
jgi:spore germination cell wall hydrolase CwlJ-like protein